MRGMFSILVLAAVIAVGLWYWRGQSDTPVDTRSETAEPMEDATAGSRTNESGAEGASGASRTAASGAATPAGTTRPADSGTTGSPPRIAAAESGAEGASGASRTAASGAATPADTTRPADSGTTGSPPRIAAVEPADDHSATRKAVPSPAPEATIEQVPNAAAATDEPGQADRLTAVERVIEQVDTAIRERLAPESGADADTKSRVQGGHDDSQGGAAQVDGERNEAARTADAGAALPADAARTTDADTATSTAPIRTTDSDAAPAPDGTRAAEAEAAAAKVAEAKQHVERLPTTSSQTIPVDKADHFVTGEHMVSLVPEDMIENVSVGALAEDDTLEAETPITVVQEVEQIEAVGPEQIISESGGDLDTKLQVLVEYDDAGGDAEQKVAVQGDTGRSGDGSDSAAPGGAGENAGEAVEEITVREALERLRSEPEKPITIIKTVRYFEVMTLRELLDAEEDTGTFLNVVTQPYRIEAATLADLLQRQKAGNPDTIFYLHTVQPTDEQGIWGIVQSGLVDNFARGMAVRRGEAVETYTVRIPRNADERLHDQSSSFLGKLIDRKTEESFVYNYRDSRMGRNPDHIHPGQEIVIINFEPEELVSIYRHFAGD